MGKATMIKKYYLLALEVHSMNDRMLVISHSILSQPEIGDVLYLYDESNSFIISGIGFVPVDKWQNGVNSIILKGITGEKIPKKGDQLFWYRGNIKK